MNWRSSSFVLALTVCGVVAAEESDRKPAWNDLPKTAGFHTLVERVTAAELPAKKKGALVGRDLLMPPLWALGHGQLRAREPSDAPRTGTEFLFDAKGRVFVLVRWREEFQEQALRELTKIGGVVYEPIFEIRHREEIPSGHLPGDFRQLDEGKMVVQRGCFVPPQKLLKFIDRPVIRYIMLADKTILPSGRGH